ncbi:MAG: hypothetical protein K2L54_05335 [Clostridiales bacterium]|nr:hypothetical protein [Clostridiales bacterium]
MSTIYKTKNGKEITLLNPAEKGKKAALELKHGCHLTNDFVVKGDKNGNPIPLTDTEKAWRSGLLSARRDSANCYNAKNGKKDKKNKSGKKATITVGMKVDS